MEKCGWGRVGGWLGGPWRSVGGIGWVGGWLAGWLTGGLGTLAARWMHTHPHTHTHTHTHTHSDGLRWWISGRRVHVYRTRHPTGLGLTQQICGLERVLGTDILVSAHEGFEGWGVVLWHVSSQTILAVSLAHPHPPLKVPCSPTFDNSKESRLGPSASADDQARRLNGRGSLIATKQRVCWVACR